MEKNRVENELAKLKNEIEMGKRESETLFKKDDLIVSLISTIV